MRRSDLESRHMTSLRLRGPTHLALAWSSALVLSASLCGCGSSGASERTGEAMRSLFPADLQKILPPDSVVCHEETTEGPTLYRLWIVRRPTPEYLDLPANLEGLEDHLLPADILIRLIRAKVPRLELGQPSSEGCRFTHWRTGSAEYQLRELTTSNGWFASIELISG